MSEGIIFVAICKKVVKECTFFVRKNRRNRRLPEKKLVRINGSKADAIKQKMRSGLSKMKGLKSLCIRGR
jgi:hypothetical protein